MVIGNNKIQTSLSKDILSASVIRIYSFRWDRSKSLHDVVRLSFPFCVDFHHSQAPTKMTSEDRKSVKSLFASAGEPVHSRPNSVVSCITYCSREKRRGQGTMIDSSTRWDRWGAGAFPRNATDRAETWPKLMDRHYHYHIAFQMGRTL